MCVSTGVKVFVVMFLINFTHVSGAVPCQDSLDCARMNLGGYTCQNLRCVCDPNTDTGLFPCRGRLFGEKCGADFECAQEVNLICARNEMRTCKCRRGYVWNIMNKICYMIDEHTFDNALQSNVSNMDEFEEVGTRIFVLDDDLFERNKGFDPVREIIIPGIIVMTIGAMVYLGIKLFCNCWVRKWHFGRALAGMGRLFRRRSTNLGSDKIGRNRRAKMSLSGTYTVRIKEDEDLPRESNKRFVCRSTSTRSEPRARSESVPSINETQFSAGGSQDNSGVIREPIMKEEVKCGKLWRRRRRQLTRELDEASHQQQATWVASYRDGNEDQEMGAAADDPFIQNYGKPWYKIPNTHENNSVFSSLNGMENRSSPVLSPSSSFPLHPTPCMGLFLPSGSLAAAAAASTTASTTSPPPYEEALKHKVILSSYPTATTVILPTAPPTPMPQMSQMPPGPGFTTNNPTGPN